MTVSFIDLEFGHWAYDLVMEAANTTLADGTPLIEGLPYQVFESGKNYVYQEFVAGKNQVRYVLDKTVTPTDSNPLYVFVDGVQFGYRNSGVKTDGTTAVNLHTPPAQGSIVSIMSPGVPKIERGRPVIKSEPFYPHYQLKNASTYTYSTVAAYNEYLTVFGKRLKRLTIPEDEYTGAGSGQTLARKYIGKRTDVYYVSYNGRIFLPWDFEGMTGSITYAYNNGGVKKTTEKFVAWSGSPSDTASEPYHLNRFFPNTWVTRAEAVEFIDRLRRYYYERLTDMEPPGPTLDFEIEAYQGQKVFRMNGTYTAGAKKLSVTRYDDVTNKWVKLVLDKDYKEFDNSTVLLIVPAEKGTRYKFYFEHTSSNDLYDVGKDVRYFVQKTGKLENINGTTDPWVPVVLGLEKDTLKDGSKLINGKMLNAFYDPAGKTIPLVDERYDVPSSGEGRRFFMPHTPITRAEMAAFTDRFRIWCMEKFL
ncbi:hypothetical protein ACPA0F_18210 [Solibacillus silvestris]